MNENGVYVVNIGTAEYQCWLAAKWIKAADVVGFHLMRIADPASRVIAVHNSNIKETKPNNTALEDEMRRLLECRELTREARQLLTAALEAQISGKMPVLDFLI